jgi:hypothetical protein
MVVLTLVDTGKGDFVKVRVTQGKGILLRLGCLGPASEQLANIVVHAL